jgi:hypothetical protein
VSKRIHHKDFRSVYNKIRHLPPWDTTAPLEDFLSSIQGAARIGQWDEAACLQVAILRLLDPAKTFYNSSLQLHAEDMMWDRFRKAFPEIFKEAHTAQYHFTELQTAREAKNEGPQEFADHCRGHVQG